MKGNNVERRKENITFLLLLLSLTIPEFNANWNSKGSITTRQKAIRISYHNRYHL